MINVNEADDSMAKKKKNTALKSEKVHSEKKRVCGIVIPISAIDGCSELHWADVLEILTDAIEDAGFDANMVSNADEIGIIQKRIIQNLYENPMVVCDVSGKNPNVMFELGLRLAFDKPTIIVKDDKTSYTFDTSPIEHLEYPRDLRFATIVEFKQKLSEKIKATHEKATSDSTYTTFLKHFGAFKVAKLEEKEVSGQEYILEELKNIRLTMRRLEGTRAEHMSNSEQLAFPIASGVHELTMEVPSAVVARRLERLFSRYLPVRKFTLTPKGKKRHQLRVLLGRAVEPEIIEYVMKQADRMRRRYL